MLVGVCRGHTFSIHVHMTAHFLLIPIVPQGFPTYDSNDVPVVIVAFLKHSSLKVPTVQLVLKVKVSKHATLKVPHDKKQLKLTDKKKDKLNVQAE